jgi:hypothetical protein
MKLGSARSILSSSKPLRGASHSQSRSGGTPAFGLLRVRRTSSATGVPVFSPSGFWPSGDSAGFRRGTPRLLPIPSPVCLRLPGGRFGTWALVEGDSVCVMRSRSLPRLERPCSCLEATVSAEVLSSSECSSPPLW